MYFDNMHNYFVSQIIVDFSKQNPLRNVILIKVMVFSINIKN